MNTQHAPRLQECLPVARRSLRWLRWVRHFAMGTALLGAALVQARTLTVCVSQNPVPPLTYPDRDGTAQTLVRRAVALQGDSVQFVTAPWMRCRMGLKNGDYDGALPLAPAIQNLEDFAFPVKTGALDAGRGVGDFTVRVLRRTGTPVRWDGVAFANLRTPVMALPGQAIARDKLRVLGAAEDATTPHAQSILRKLVAGRAEVAVLPAGFVQQELALPEFRDAVEVLPQPLLSSPSFLGFNRDFQRREAAYVEAVWAAMGQLRAAPGNGAGRTLVSYTKP